MPETNNAREVGFDVHEPVFATVAWTDSSLKQIERIRLLTEPGTPFYDVSYVHGRNHDGQKVRVRVPFYQLQRRALVAQMTEYARRDGVYLRGLCAGDVNNVLSLCF